MRETRYGSVPTRSSVRGKRTGREEVIAEMVRLICEVGRPLKVVLFEPQARGWFLKAESGLA